MMGLIQAPLRDLESEAIQARIAAQRAARLERDAHLPARHKTTRSLNRGGTEAEFWAQVDRRRGPDSCHMWCGPIDDKWASYEVGKFQMQGLATTLVHRIAVALTFDSELPQCFDVVPECEERMCCNVDHLMVQPAGHPLKRVKARAFFCSQVAN